MLRAYGATGFRVARSFRCAPFPLSDYRASDYQTYTHIFAAAGTHRVPLSQPQKRHIPPERYAT
jgi:hypothetical protein